MKSKISVFSAFRFAVISSHFASRSLVVISLRCHW